MPSFPELPRGLRFGFISKSWLNLWNQHAHSISSCLVDFCFSNRPTGELQFKNSVTHCNVAYLLSSKPAQLLQDSEEDFGMMRRESLHSLPQYRPYVAESACCAKHYTWNHTYINISLFSFSIQVFVLNDFWFLAMSALWQWVQTFCPKENISDGLW